jgi:hypothetical protein
VSRALRDTILFLLGVFGYLHQFLLTTEPHILLVTLATGALGLPLALRRDEGR